jgi:acetylornithine deacetylase/succinyl-diaminopimelate desuccinylase-like protein
MNMKERRNELYLSVNLITSSGNDKSGIMVDWTAFEDEVVHLLSNLIKIDTTNPPGGETRAAEFLKDILEKEGIACEIVEMEKGRGNLIASLGEGKKRLLYMSHLDVVPAIAERWTYPPFSGLIKDGYVWGRGALDCKDLVACEAATLMLLKREGAALSGKLIFAPVADEEKGGVYGAQYLVRDHWDKIKADFSLNEGTGEPFSYKGKVAYFIQTGEKGIAWTKLRTKGLSSHGSIPSLGVNAVVKMADVVRRLVEYRPEVMISPEVSKLLKLMFKLMGREVSPTKGTLDVLLDELSKTNRTFSEQLRAITRMTVSPNVISGGTKTNIIPDECRCEVDIRVLGGQTKEYVISELKNSLGDAEIESMEFSEPSFSSSESEFYNLLAKTLREIVGNVEVAPYILTGGTDSRFLRRIGIQAYGFSPLSLEFPVELINTVHGVDERIDTKSLRLKTEFLYRVATRYLS